MTGELTLTWMLSAKHRADVLGSLDRIGSDKAIGYLPLQTIEHCLGLNVDEIIANGRARGLAVLLLESNECCIRSGALYIYDPVALKRRLRASAATLKQARFPRTPEAFVRAIARDWLELDHPVIPVIKAAFADVSGSP